MVAVDMGEATSDAKSADESVARMTGLRGSEKRNAANRKLPFWRDARSETKHYEPSAVDKAVPLSGRCMARELQLYMQLGLRDCT